MTMSYIEISIIAGTSHACLVSHSHAWCMYHGSIMTVQWAPGGLGLPQYQTTLAAQLAQLVNHLVVGGGAWLSWDG